MIKELQETPMPARIARLPRTESGYPAPFFVIIGPDGKPDPRILDPIKQVRCFTDRLCGICGERWDWWMFFISGPQALEHRVSADPPMHEECARYALKVCPYLCRPRAKRAKEYSVPTLLTPGVDFIPERPERFALIKARASQIKFGRASRTQPGMLYQYPPPIEVEWFDAPKEVSDAD